MLQFPGQAVGNEDAPGSGLERGTHIGFHRIADHHGAFGPVAMGRKGTGIDRGLLVRNDLDGIEKLPQPRLGELAFLIQKIALGDEDEAMAFGKRPHRFLRLGQQLDRMGKHLLPGGEDLGDDACGHAGFRHLDRGFDHRQHEALDTEPVVPEVAPLGLQEPGVKKTGIGVVRQKLREPVLGHAIEGLVLPERVVGIEADRRDPLTHRSGPSFLNRPQAYILRPEPHTTQAP